MNEIALEQVSRVYGREFALHRVSVTLREKTVTALVGENGAGKTTLLNILATLDRPTSGRIRFGDQNFDSFASQGREKLGWVSHDSLVYEDLTGHENLTFYGRMYGLEDAEARAERWLERVGLDDVPNRRVRAYSRGMRQRLSVARALIHEPKLLLLDEPLTGLDRGGRQLLVDLFAEHRDRGCIVVMITHDLHATRDLVDRVAVLKRGKLTYYGDDDVMEAFTSHG